MRLASVLNVQQTVLNVCQVEHALLVLQGGQQIALSAKNVRVPV